MDLKINKEFKDLIPPLSQDEYNNLEKSILDEGCRDALIVWDEVIVDGHNRYEICKNHNIPFETMQKDFSSVEDAKVWMIDNQKGRRNLTDGWKWELAQAKKKILLEKGRENKGANQYTPERKLSTIDKTHHNTRQEIAKDLGWSTGKVAMADKVWKEADDETKEKVKSGDVSINQAYQKVKKEKKKEERLNKIKTVKQKIEEENIKILDKYDVIAIDPPWEYSEKGGFSSSQHDADGNRGGVDYPTMTVYELKKLELPAKKNCVLFLWTTHAFMRDAFDLLEEWGFEYKAIITWDKEKMGMGRTIRMQCEFCLLAKKGDAIINGSSVRDIIHEPRREHSRKPDKFYEIVESMTYGRRLDYFSREKRPNWDVYGAESDKF